MTMSLPKSASLEVKPSLTGSEFCTWPTGNRELNRNAVRIPVLPTSIKERVRTLTGIIAEEFPYSATRGKFWHVSYSKYSPNIY